MWERRDGICIQQSDRGTGNCIGEARPGYQHCEVVFFLGGGAFGFAAKGFGKTVEDSKTSLVRYRLFGPSVT
jgi:hypothetical protein